MTHRRIGFDARFINDSYHGIGRFAFRLLEALVDLVPEWTFVIFRGRGKDSRFDWSTIITKSNVEIASGPWPLYWPQEHLFWPAILRRLKVDLFHSPYISAPFLVSKPVVTTVHDLIFDRYPTYMPMPWTRPYYKLLMRLAVTRSTKVIAVSQATARELSHFYPVSQGKIAVIPEGVDEEFSPLANPAKGREILERYKIDRPFILTVGARRPHKNLERLVQAFASSDSRRSHDLVFAGPADSRFPDFARQATHLLGLNSQAHFLEWVPEPDLPILYSLADLVVLPSLLEGFELAALEAMACGTPVAAARNTSFPEIMSEAGNLFDPLNVDEIRKTIDGIIENDSLRQEIARRGRAHAADFHWKKTAQHTYDLYHNILQ